METTSTLTEIQFEELMKLVLEEEEGESKTVGDSMRTKLLFLIDVREESELEESGWIPTAINIPLGDFEISLELPSDEFEGQYGRVKPKKEAENEAEFVVYCRSGRRAILAHQIATKIGYEKARCYKGSFLEWQSKGGPIINK